MNMGASGEFTATQVGYYKETGTFENYQKYSSFPYLSDYAILK